MPDAEYPRLRVVLADSKYHNQGLRAWLRGHRRRYAVGVVSRPEAASGFVPLWKRWVVERTLAWLGRYRRLGRDHVRLAETSAAMVQLGAIYHTLRRLRPAKPRYRWSTRAGTRPGPPFCSASPVEPCARSSVSWDCTSRPLWKPTKATCPWRTGCRPRDTYQSRLETSWTRDLCNRRAGTLFTT
jgi:putative transposase